MCPDLIDHAVEEAPAAIDIAASEAPDIFRRQYDMPVGAFYRGHRAAAMVEGRTSAAAQV